MKNMLMRFSLFIVGLLVTLSALHPTPTLFKPHKSKLDLTRLPLYFIANRGQVNPQAVFYARTPGYTLWLTAKGMVFDAIVTQHGIQKYSNHGFSRDVSGLTFVNSRKDTRIVSIDKPSAPVNFFRGSDRSRWHLHVPATPAVVYRHIYQGIDLKVYGSRNQIEYDWIVKPGGNPSDIIIKYQGVKHSGIQPDGNLIIQTETNEFLHQRPIAYQMIDGRRVRVNSTFIALGNHTYGFRTGKYHRNLPLVIDPVILAYATYLGGSGNDYALAIAADNIGSAYVTGHTYSTGFPVSGQYQSDQPDIDVFVSRIDTNQSGVSSLVYSTYLGGSGLDYGMGIAVNGSGTAYICGLTQSADFPLKDQYQSYQGAGDAFIVTLDTNAAGAASLLYATCLGGTSSDHTKAIAVDAAGLVYVTGITSSSDFPLVNQFQIRQGGSDVIAAKIDTTQGAAGLLYSTILGSSGDEYGYGIAVDNSANAYITGHTNVNSTSFPALNGYQTDQPQRDVFVTRLNTTLSGASSLVYSTYLGGDDDDYGEAIAVDNSGSAYVTGRTGSTDFPTQNAYQTYPSDGFSNAFVTRIDTGLSGAASLVYSSYLGGSGPDAGYAIALDSSSNVYVGGDTWSSDFPLSDYFQAAQGNQDAFISKINTNLSGASGLIFSTLLGGSGHDYCRGIAVDSSGSVYVTGYTPSSDFPVMDPFQSKQPGICAYVARLDHHALPIVTTQALSSISPTAANCGGSVLSQGDSAVTARGVCWSVNSSPDLLDNITTDGSGLGTFASSLTGLLPGTRYYVRAYASNAAGTAYGSIISFVTFSYPTVSGKILDGTQPLAGVTITFSHNGHSETTGVDGTYSYTTAWGIATEVRASKTGFTFTPESYRFTSLKANKPNRDFHALKVTPANPPHIQLSRSRLNYGSIIDGAQTGVQTLLVENTGGGTLAWTASVSNSWIKVSPKDGAADTQVSVSIDAKDLETGLHLGTVSIIDANADNSPAKVNIVLEVKEKNSEHPPIGGIDAPTQGSTVYSAVPVTGYALDDTEIQRVKIYRNPIPGHETGAIYVGDALLVEGARPDIETALDQYPKNYLAGWSYILLTNFLPGGGNDTFVITAVAEDNSGNEKTLGSRTIICDNAHAVKPFGAIDTPVSGGIASGRIFLNFAWALTPPPNTIPADGSTIKVYIDGVPMAGNPVYNLYRSDIASGFPGYANSQAAVGYYTLDTTLFANGVHTISWSVTDNAGNSADIGSRYFRIMNIVNPSTVSTATSSGPCKFYPFKQSKSKIRRVHISAEETIKAPQHLHSLEIKEQQRIKVEIGSGFTGFMKVGERLKRLPPGSFCDPLTGVFYWQAGNGFIGEYRFIFVKRKPNGLFEKKELKIVVHPKF